MNPPFRRSFFVQLVLVIVSVTVVGFFIHELNKFPAQQPYRTRAETVSSLLPDLVVQQLNPRKDPATQQWYLDFIIANYGQAPVTTNFAITIYLDGKRLDVVSAFPLTASPFLAVSASAPVISIPLNDSVGVYSSRILSAVVDSLDTTTPMVTGGWDPSSSLAQKGLSDNIVVESNEANNSWTPVSASFHPDNLPLNNQCAAKLFLYNSWCVSAKRAAAVQCGGVAMSLLSDQNNCGACGTVCSDSQSCIVGKCSAAQTVSIELQHQEGQQGQPAHGFSVGSVSVESGVAPMDLQLKNSYEARVNGSSATKTTFRVLHDVTTEHFGATTSSTTTHQGTITIPIALPYSASATTVDIYNQTTGQKEFSINLADYLTIPFDFSLSKVKDVAVSVGNSTIASIDVSSVLSNVSARSVSLKAIDTSTTPEEAVTIAPPTSALTPTTEGTPVSLSVTTTSQTTIGPHVMLAYGMGGNRYHQTTFTVTVTPPPPLTIALSDPNPNSFNLLNEVEYQQPVTITSTLTNHTNQVVTLNAQDVTASSPVYIIPSSVLITSNGSTTPFHVRSSDSSVRDHTVTFTLSAPDLAPVTKTLVVHVGPPPAVPDFSFSLGAPDPDGYSFSSLYSPPYPQQSFTVPLTVTNISLGHPVTVNITDAATQSLAISPKSWTVSTNGTSSTTVSVMVPDPNKPPVGNHRITIRASSDGDGAPSQEKIFSATVEPFVFTYSFGSPSSSDVTLSSKVPSATITFPITLNHPESGTNDFGVGFAMPDGYLRLTSSDNQHITHSGTVTFTLTRVPPPTVAVYILPFTPEDARGIFPSDQRTMKVTVLPDEVSPVFSLALSNASALSPAPVADNVTKSTFTIAPRLTNYTNQVVTLTAQDEAPNGKTRLAITPPSVTITNNDTKSFTVVAPVNSDGDRDHSIIVTLSAANGLAQKRAIPVHVSAPPLTLSPISMNLTTGGAGQVLALVIHATRFQMINVSVQDQTLLLNPSALLTITDPTQQLMTPENGIVNSSFSSISASSNTAVGDHTVVVTATNYNHSFNATATVMVHVGTPVPTDTTPPSLPSSPWFTPFQTTVPFGGSFSFTASAVDTQSEIQWSEYVLQPLSASAPSCQGAPAPRSAGIRMTLLRYGSPDKKAAIFQTSLAPASGRYCVWVRASDALGNISPWQTSANYALVEPTFTMTLSKTTLNAGSTVPLNIVADVSALRSNNAAFRYWWTSPSVSTPGAEFFGITQATGSASISVPQISVAKILSAPFTLHVELLNPYATGTNPSYPIPIEQTVDVTVRKISVPKQ